MDVHVAAVERLLGQAERRRVGLHVAHRRARRLAHHLAELTRQRELALAGHPQRLDVEHLAADGRPGQPSRHAGHAVRLPRLGLELVGAEDGLDLRRVDLPRLQLARGLLHGQRAADVCDALLQRAHAGLTRVARCDALQRRVGEDDLRVGQRVGLQLLRHQVRARDGDFFRLRVAGDLEDLHAVAQRRGDGLERVGGGDEEHARQIDRHLEIVIDEGLVLLGVEDLQQRRRRVALEAGAKLVDLVEHDDGVHRAGPLERLHDAARERAHVGAPVAADLRLVAHAAQRHAQELAAHGARDRLPERSLAHAGRTREAENGPLQIAAQRAHREELEHALLHLGEPVVIGVERAARVLHVEVVFGLRLPGHFRDPLQPGARNGALGRALGQLAQPGQLLGHLTKDVFGQPDPLQLLFQIVLFGPLAQLGLDGFHLLAQDVLALGLRDLLLHGPFDVVSSLERLAPARQQRDDDLETLDGIEDLQQAPLLISLGGDVVAEEVGERAGVLDGVEPSAPTCSMRASAAMS